MTTFPCRILPWLLLGGCLLSTHLRAAMADPEPAPAAASFSYSVAKAGPTSAGVYNAAGELVRVLWTLQTKPAGRHQADWDGLDNFGQPAPAGRYSYRVVVNHSSYRNLGQIGNSGENTFQHVPNNFEAVAVDSAGNIFTVHDWDEPHHDVKMWSPRDGRVVAHSGHPIGGLLKAVAVDDDYVYTTTYENLTNRATARFYITRLRLNRTPGTAGWPRQPFTVAGDNIMVYNGKAEFPEGVSPEDQGVMNMPLLSLAVQGNNLYATDSLAGLVRCYHKATGEERAPIKVPLPQSVTVTPEGNLWVGHEHRKVSLFSPTGEALASPPVELKEINALAWQGGRLYVADQGAGQVKIFTFADGQLKLQQSLGSPARPGDRAAHRFFTLHGLAVDKDGNIITAQNEYFFNGGRLAKFTPEGKPLWEKLGLEFVSNATYSATNPDWLVSLQHHGYKLDRKAGTALSTGNTYRGEGYKSGIGPIRATLMGKNELVYMANGDGILIYKVMSAADAFRGPTLALVGALGGSNPLPNGTSASESWRSNNHFLWSWHDEQGDNLIQENEVVVFQRPEMNAGLFQKGPLAADSKGNLWFAGYDWAGGRAAGEIWVIPPMGINRLGYPIYDWKNARRATSRDQIQLPAGSDGKGAQASPKMAQAASDGSIYAYGHTSRAGTPQDGGLHMGGNMLMRFELKPRARLDGPEIPLPKGPVPFGSPDYIQTPVLADIKWKLPLPAMTVGIDAIPPGKQPHQRGVMIGGFPWRGEIHHYTRDGLLIGKFASDPVRFGGVKGDGHHPSGLMDFYGALAVNRDPRDGVIDVFVEDDYNNRIFWYRVDDRAQESITGTLQLIRE